jgi:magnesium chelatase family protein
MLTDPGGTCQCSSAQVARYHSRLSGPLLDRIDIHLEVPRLKQDELLQQGGQGEPSAAIRARVQAARERQRARFAGSGVFTNAAMSSQQLRKHCAVSPAVRDLLRAAINNLGLSGRAYDRILKLARTIADLAGSDGIDVPHVAEAIQYRTLDRKLWA